MLVAPEPFEADDAGRPRPEAPLALDPRDDGRRRDVVQTLLEAVALVVLVVVVFLQGWRASIVPLIAVPVSIIGTCAALP